MTTVMLDCNQRLGLMLKLESSGMNPVAIKSDRRRLTCYSQQVDGFFSGMSALTLCFSNEGREMDIDGIIGVCRLCRITKLLEGSHIIPAGLLRISKATYPQLIAMSFDHAPRMENVNWNEPLLCKDCESLLNNSYEKREINKLKSESARIDYEERISWIKYDFKACYLFWVSILWRASESSQSFFKNVQLPSDTAEMLRSALYHGETRYGRFEINEYVQVGICRVLREGFDTRNLISGIRATTQKDSARYTFMIAGFAVVYQFSNKPSVQLPFGFSLVKPGFTYRMNKVRPGQSRILDELHEDAAEIAARHPEFSKKLKS